MYIYFMDWIGLFYARKAFIYVWVYGGYGLEIICHFHENFQYAFHFSLSIAFYIIG